MSLPNGDHLPDPKQLDNWESENESIRKRPPTMAMEMCLLGRGVIIHAEMAGFLSHSFGVIDMLMLTVWIHCAVNLHREGCQLAVRVTLTSYLVIASY